MSSLLTLEKAALLYLDQNNLIDYLKKKCHLYASCNDKIYQFIIPVNPCDLTEIDTTLGSLVLSQPTAASQIFQQVIYATIQTLELLPDCTNISQVVIYIRLSALPSIPDYQLKTTRNVLHFAKTRKFLQYQGIVCGISAIHKYTKIARFVCKNKTCRGSKGDKYIRLHTPGAREGQTIRSDFCCPLCSSFLEEDLTYRILGDKLIIELVDKEAFSVEQTGKYHQSIMACIRDDLITDAEIGKLLCVIGTPILDAGQGILFLEINSVLQNVTTQLAAGPSLPQSFSCIFQEKQKSPWSFSLHLAYEFAGNIAPCGTCLHLKLGLLLSLVADLSKESSRLDLLAIGNDTLVLNRLLIYAAGLSPKHVMHTGTFPLTTSFSKSRFGDAHGIITGGPMLLANGGICIIPNLNSCNKQTKYCLLQALENNKIMTEIPQKLTTYGTSQTSFFPRQCSIWATLNPNSTSKHVDDLQIDFKSKDITQALIDVFGFVFFVEVPVDSYADTILTSHILRQGMALSVKPSISETDLKEFLQLARCIKPDFSEASQNLIKGYYVASRTVRDNDAQLWTPPPNAVKVVTALSEAHAKLCLREVVTEHDAVMAILLYEEYVTVRSGQSLLGVKPLFHVKDKNLEYYIGKERDKQLFQFEKHLKNFIYNHAPETKIIAFEE